MSELFGNGPGVDANELPVSAEIYSVERLEQYAQTLAAEHRDSCAGEAVPSCCRAWRTTAANWLVRIAHSSKQFAKAGRYHPRPSGWLITFILSKSSCARFARTCRRSYYHELPKLADGELKDYPQNLCRGPGSDRAHRLPSRYEHAAPVHLRLSNRGSAFDRRVVGGRDHAAPGAGRESAPPRRRRSCAREKNENRPTNSPTSCLELASRRPDALVPLLVSERFGKTRENSAVFCGATNPTTARTGSGGDAGD